MSEPAFPFVHSPTGFATDVRHFKGLTKREYFAAQALQAILASGDSSRVSFEEYATCAVHHADALLATLKRIPPTAGERS